MRKWQLWLGVILAFANCAWAGVRKVKAEAPGDYLMPKAKLEQLLSAKVQSEWESLRDRDANAYGNLLSDDFVGVEEDGNGTRDKRHAVGEIAQSNIHNYFINFFKVLPLLPSTAYVSYEITMEFPPKATNRIRRMYVSEVWMRDNGQWKLQQYQETRVK